MFSIGLHGLKKSGKDTVANYLVMNYGFTQFAFADAVYREVAAAFGVREDDLRSREWKENVQSALELRNCTDREFVRIIVQSETPSYQFDVTPFCAESQSCPRTSTFIVQRWATEYKRAMFGTTYWSDIVLAEVAKLPVGTPVVFSDVREPHEVQVVRTYGGTHPRVTTKIIAIDCMESTSTGHSSDVALPAAMIDQRINNIRGDMPGLFRSIDNVINRGK